MKEKIIKPLLVHMIGLLITQCIIFGYNPLAIGWFGAMTTIERYSVTALPIIIMGLYYAMGTLGAAKYGIVMITIMFVATLFRKKNGKVTMKEATIITGCALFAIELSEWFMNVNISNMYGESITYGYYYELALIIMLALAAGSGASVFATAVGGFTGEIIYPKQENSYVAKQINQAIVANNKNMQKIANGFKDLSYKIMDMPQANGIDRLELNIEDMTEQISGRVCGNCNNCGICWGSKAEKSKENVIEMMATVGRIGKISKEQLPTSLASQCVNQNELILGVNHIFERARLNFIWRTKLEESRMAVAIQLGEMADMVEQFSKSDYQAIRFDVNIEEYLKAKLKGHRILVKKIKVTENTRGLLQVEVKAKAKGKYEIPISVMEKVLSTYLNEEIRLSHGEHTYRNTLPKYVGCEYERFNFVEAENFDVICGVAGKTKDNESVSGDNYTLMNMGNGQMFMSICDGMGSGDKADRYSRITVELLEQLLKNGFGEDTALRLVNSVLMLGNQWDSPLAVDIGLVDLYSGNCNFVKMGAACTYIKRGSWVECLHSSTLPMGAAGIVEYDTVTKKLYSGDFVVMVSDGMIEDLDVQDKEETMGRIIMEIDTVNPKDMAEQIMRKTKEISEGNAKDDGTVLVVGIWDKI